MCVKYYNTSAFQGVFMNIRSKILCAMFASVILSIGGVLAVAYFEMSAVFVENYKANSTAQLERMEAFMGNFFSSSTSMAEMIAEDSLVTENINTITSYVNTTQSVTTNGESLPTSEREIYLELLGVHEAYPDYMLVYVSNNEGGITQAPNDMMSAGFNPSRRPWYIDTVSANSSIITEAYISDNGQAVCTVATPIRSQRGTIEGVMALDITLTTLTEETGSVQVGETGYVLLLDHWGQVVSDPRNSGSNIPENERWLGKMVEDIPGDASTVLAQLQAMGEGYMEVDIDGTAWLASVQTTDYGWSLIMLQEKAEVFAGAQSVIIAIAQIGVVIAVILLAAAWVVASSIAKPIATLVQASHEVAEGDLHAMPEDSHMFNGELKLLHSSLKRMVNKLVELIDTANAKIKEAEHALDDAQKAKEAAEQANIQAKYAQRDGAKQTALSMKTIIDQLTQTAERLASEAEETGHRTAEQQQRVVGTATAITEISNTIAGVASSTTRTASLAENARKEAQLGKELVFKLVSNMTEIENKALATQESLAVLREQASGVEQIMNIITDIADQTNLLALNAAIEAARAGDAGRGFAVVADEVRKLAEKTMQATKEVGDTISTIQHGTDNNMAAIGETVSFIASSVSVVSDAGKSLEDIENMVKNTAGETLSIATASEEQSTTLEEVNHSTDELNELTAKVASSAAASYEIIQELSKLTNGLNEIMDNLQKE